MKIPGSVTCLGNSSFSRNELTRVNIPDNVANIGNYAFSNNNLTEIQIPKSVTEIRGNSFSRNNLTEVQIPEGVTIIGFASFSSNDLKEITIPDSVTSIGGSAFLNNQLTSVSIPDSVTQIEARAFKNNELTSVSIPDSVIHIGERAFRNNRLASVTLGNNLTEIEDFSFTNNKLTAVTIPDSVQSLGSYAFSSNKLESVSIGESVEIISDFAFHTNQLTNVVIPDSVKEIGDYAFRNNQLESVSIGNNVERIRSYAFCGNALTSLVLPDSVRSISHHAFQYNNLKSVKFGSGLISIRQLAFTHNQLSSVTIPENVSSIGWGAFNNNQLTSLTIGENVWRIEWQAFANNKLTSVTIPESVRILERGAFFGNQLNTAIVPGNVTSIEENVFANNQPQPRDLTIYGFWDTAAHDYAQANDHTFIDLSSTGDDWYIGPRSYTFNSPVVKGLPLRVSVLTEKPFVPCSIELNGNTVSVNSSFSRLRGGHLAFLQLDTHHMDPGDYLMEIGIGDTTHEESVTILPPQSFNLSENMEKLTVNSRDTMKSMLQYPANAFRDILFGITPGLSTLQTGSKVIQYAMPIIEESEENMLAIYEMMQIRGIIEELPPGAMFPVPVILRPASYYQSRLDQFQNVEDYVAALLQEVFFRRPIYSRDWQEDIITRQQDFMDTESSFRQNLSPEEVARINKIIRIGSANIANTANERIYKEHESKFFRFGWEPTLPYLGQFQSGGKSGLVNNFLAARQLESVMALRAISFFLDPPGIIITPDRERLAESINGQ